MEGLGISQPKRAFTTTKFATGFEDAAQKFYSPLGHLHYLLYFQTVNLIHTFQFANLKLQVLH